MKNFRLLCAAFAMTAALAVPVFAGDIGTGITSPPPTPSAAGDIGTGATANGEIGTGLTSEETEAVAGASIAEAALSLLQSVLALV